MPCEEQVAEEDKLCKLARSLVERPNAATRVRRSICWSALRSARTALHAEKYYRTVSEEFARKLAFRWRQFVALARITASEYGQAAPGHAEAGELLKVS